MVTMDENEIPRSRATEGSNSMPGSGMTRTLRHDTHCTRETDANTDILNYSEEKISKPIEIDSALPMIISLKRPVFRLIGHHLKIVRTIPISSETNSNDRGSGNGANIIEIYEGELSDITLISFTLANVIATSREVHNTELQRDANLNNDEVTRSTLFSHNAAQITLQSSNFSDHGEEYQIWLPFVSFLRKWPLIVSVVKEPNKIPNSTSSEIFMHNELPSHRINIRYIYDKFGLNISSKKVGACLPPDSFISTMYSKFQSSKESIVGSGQVSNQPETMSFDSHSAHFRTSSISNFEHLFTFFSKPISCPLVSDKLNTCRPHCGNKYVIDLANSDVADIEKSFQVYLNNSLVWGTPNGIQELRRDIRKYIVETAQEQKISNFSVNLPSLLDYLNLHMIRRLGSLCGNLKDSSCDFSKENQKDNLYESEQVMFSESGDTTMHDPIDEDEELLYIRENKNIYKHPKVRSILVICEISDGKVVDMHFVPLKATDIRSSKLIVWYSCLCMVSYAQLATMLEIELRHLCSTKDLPTERFSVLGALPHDNKERDQPQVTLIASSDDIMDNTLINHTGLISLDSLNQRLSLIYQSILDAPFIIRLLVSPLTSKCTIISTWFCAIAMMISLRNPFSIDNLQRPAQISMFYIPLLLLMITNVADCAQGFASFGIIQMSHIYSLLGISTTITSIASLIQLWIPSLSYIASIGYDTSMLNIPDKLCQYFSSHKCTGFREPCYDLNLIEIDPFPASCLKGCSIKYSATCESDMVSQLHNVAVPLTIVTFFAILISLVFIARVWLLFYILWENTHSLR